MLSTTDRVGVPVALSRRLRIGVYRGDPRSGAPSVSRHRHADGGVAQGDAGVGPAFDPAAYPHETVACNLCGRDDATPIAARDRYGLPTRIVQCVCGLRYITPRMTAEGYAAFYRTGYRALVAQVSTAPTALEFASEQWRYAGAIADRVAPWMRARTVLDVGGSTGVVGRLFQARWGCEVTVIDPSPTELAQARGCRTICASAERVDFPSADLALLCRTVDHLRDPLGVLTRLRASVRMLVVDAMDVDAWPEPWRYKVDHPYAFTGPTLREFMRRAGFRPIQAWTTRHGKYLGYLCS